MGSRAAGQPRRRRGNPPSGRERFGAALIEAHVPPAPTRSKNIPLRPIETERRVAVPSPDDPRPPSLSEMEEYIRRMPDGPRKAEMLERVRELKHLFAMHDSITQEIALRVEDERD